MIKTDVEETINNPVEYTAGEWIKYSRRAFPQLMIIITALFWGIQLFSGLPAAPFIILTVFSVMITIFWLYLLNRTSGVKIGIDSDNITLTKGKEKVAMSIDSIERIDFPMELPGIGMNVQGGGVAIRIPPGIFNVEEFLTRLKNTLDEKGKSDCYDGEKLFKFMKTSAFGEQMNVRIMQDHYWQFFFAFFNATLLGAFFQIFGRMGVTAIIIMAFPAIVTSAVEGVFHRRFEKECNEEAFTCPERDKEFESQLYKKALIISGLALFLLVAGSLVYIWFIR